MVPGPENATGGRPGPKHATGGRSGAVEVFFFAFPVGGGPVAYPVGGGPLAYPGGGGPWGLGLEIGDSAMVFVFGAENW